MSQSVMRVDAHEEEPVRVLGRGLRASRGVRLTLRTVRDAVGVTQADIAKLARIDQGDISRLENRADLGECQVATLRRYIEALGGDLQLVARFGERCIVLVGTTSDEPSRAP